MTNVYDEQGILLPVTVVEAGPCSVLQVKTAKTDGYFAVQLGLGEKRPKRVKKPQTGFFKKLGITPKKVIKELRMGPSEVEQYKIGQTLTVAIFKEGEYVDIVGTSKGKGFQGGVKRWGWAGGPKTHGSMFHRRAGSIGASAYPSRVYKGSHMPGRMGGEIVTIQNVEIVKVDTENNLLVLKGALPGHRNSFVVVKRAKNHFTQEADSIPQQEEGIVAEENEAAVSDENQEQASETKVASEEETSQAEQKQ